MNKKTIIKSTLVIVAIALICFGVMWLFLFGFNKSDTASVGEPFNSSHAQTLIGYWETIDFKTSDGHPMSYEGVVWVFTESEVRYFENGVELMGRPFSYQWTNNDTIKMSDGGSNERIWRLKFNDENNLTVNDVPSGYIRTLVKSH